MRNFIVFFLFVLAISSCRTPQIQPTYNGRDSVVVRRDTVIFRDTTILYVPKDSSVFSDVDLSEKSHLETDLAESDVWFSDGLMHHTLRNKQVLIPITIQYPIAISEQKEYVSLVHRETVKVNELTKHQERMILIGYISLSIIVLFVLRKIRKFVAL